MAGHQILIEPGRHRRPVARYAARGAIAVGALGAVLALASPVIPRLPADHAGSLAHPPAAPVSPPDSRERQLARLPQWRQIRREARARADSAAPRPIAEAATPSRGVSPTALHPPRR